VKAIGASEKAGPMELMEINRHSPRDFDVVIDVKVRWGMERRQGEIGHARVPGSARMYAT